MVTVDEVDHLEVSMDADVMAVIGFMQQRMAMSKLVGIANGVAALAPSLWGHAVQDPVSAVRVVARPPDAGTPDISGWIDFRFEARGVAEAFRSNLDPDNLDAVTATS